MYFSFWRWNFATPTFNIFRQNFQCVERLNLFAEKSSGWRDWIYQKLFSSAGRWNISFSCVSRLNLLQKHLLPGVKRLNFHGLFWCGGKMENFIFVCGQIECFTETYSGLGEIEFSQKDFLVWRHWNTFSVCREIENFKTPRGFEDWNNAKLSPCVERDCKFQ